MFLLKTFLSLLLQKTTWLANVETRPTVSQCGKTQPLTHQTAKQSVASFWFNILTAQFLMHFNPVGQSSFPSFSGECQLSGGLHGPLLGRDSLHLSSRCLHNQIRILQSHQVTFLSFLRRRQVHPYFWQVHKGTRL